ncbi:MAG: hypothetical protein MUC95_06470 [Spirochaetes bacterium]|nr:hypothetical protein [Spirochaetota bacterium]
MNIIYKIIVIFIIVFMPIRDGIPAVDNGKETADPKVINSIAVVSSKFDSVETLLKIYGVPYVMLKYEDLENESIFEKHTAIFFPCGIGSYVETNVNILSRGTSVQAVYLKDNYREIDKDKICTNIKRFVQNGGSAYFSDYSYEFVPDSDDIFRFFNGFPNMGVLGNLDIELDDELKIFCRRGRLNGFAAHSGWIAVRKVHGADVLASGKFKTIKGDKSGPVVVRLNTGKGEALYTSYHGSRDSEELKRYLIYRVCYKYLLDAVIDESAKWDQQVESTIIDSVREWEVCRLYPVPLVKGNNTIYFTADKGLFQIDLSDDDDNLIISIDKREKDFSFNVDCESDGYYILSVYPAYPRSSGVYSIALSKGIRIIPYYKKILFILLAGLIIFIIFMIRKILGIRRFSGRYG